MDDWTPQWEQQDDTVGSPEEFDKSWPYNFKWGYNPETNQAHVWRVQGGTDGRPVHRAELQRIWGRPTSVQSGDALGLARYVPAEMKLDGTVVAPPVVQIQAYYKTEVPQPVFDWFEEHFPGCVARLARLAAFQKQAEDDWGDDDWALAPDPEAGEENCIKWVYADPEGLLLWETDHHQLPTHDQAMTKAWGRTLVRGKDYWGYAFALPGGRVEVETGRFDTPIKALQEVKAKLAEMFPNDEISLPTVREDHENLGVEFGGTDPSVHVDHATTAAWAQEHLGSPAEMPLGGRVSHSQSLPGVSRVDVPHSRFSSLKWLLSSWPVLAGADLDGAMVALFLPEDVAEKLKIEGGEPTKQMHITLAYFTDKAADRDDWEDLHEPLANLASQYPKFTGSINGYGVFNNDEDVLFAIPSVPGLEAFRTKVVEACEEAGFPVSEEHGWVPHITLKYAFEGDLPRFDEPLQLQFPDLRFARGTGGTDFPFEGKLEPKEGGWFSDHAANPPSSNDSWNLNENDDGRWEGEYKDGSNMEFGPETWSGWKNAHRFVTDGKNILTEPEENLRWRGKGWHGQGHPEMAEEFGSRWPDYDQHLWERLAMGWAVPTIDDKGYGVFAYNYPEKAGPEDVLAIVQKELGKPTHLTDRQRLRNSGAYQAYPEGGHYAGWPDTAALQPWQRLRDK